MTTGSTRRPGDRGDERAGGDDAGTCVVAIGAAFEDLPAVGELLRALPADGGLSFVIVPDAFRPAGAPGDPAAWLARLGVPAEMVRDGAQPRAGGVYLAAPGDHPDLRDGTFSTGRRRRHRHETPFSGFCTTLAREQGACAACVSMSGALGDAGLAATTAGGIALVQMSDGPDGGPGQLVHRGELVLPLPEIVATLVRHGRQSRARRDAQAPVPAAREDLDTIAGLLADRLGPRVRAYRRGLLEQRIRRRMRLLGIDRMADYADLLREDPSHVDLLMHDLLIGVTGFLRDPEAWRQLRREVIEPMVHGRRDGEPIRIWVAACATGEEAYSMAMLVLDVLAEKPCPVWIFATDLDADAIETARRGEYAASALAPVDPAWRLRYFDELPGGHWFRARRELRECVTFARHDLLVDPPLAHMDLVSCRNVLMFFERAVQRSLFDAFHIALRPQGVLVLGSAEAVSVRDGRFACLSPKWRLYTKVTVEAAGRSVLAPPRHGVLRPQPDETTARLGEVVQRVLADRFGQGAILVDDRDQVLFVSGPVDGILAFPEGVPTRDLWQLLRPDLAGPLADLLPRARGAAEPVRLEGVPGHFATGEAVGGVAVLPVTVPGQAGMPLLVVFERSPGLPASGVHGGGTARTTSPSRRLRDENRRLQARIAELEVAAEAYRSRGEELESAREEAHAVNEDLTARTVALQARLRDLATENAELRDVVESAGFEALCLDRDLCVRWYTPALREVFPLRSTDAGRPIADIATGPLASGLEAESRDAMAGNVAIQRELATTEGLTYIRRTQPYHAAEETVAGVIVTFVDITVSRRVAEAALRAKQSFADALEARVAERTRQLRVLTAALVETEERERRLLAHELHDGLIQLLSLVSIRLSSLRDDSGGAARDGLDGIATLVDEANRDLRGIAAQLSPTILDELGLVPALHWLCDEMRARYGLSVTLADDGRDKPLARAVAATVFRAVRELLVNVAKHAGVRGAEVALRTQGDRLVVTVRDGGQGFDAFATARPSATGGLGLASVRERIGLMGGTFRVDSRPGEGTRAELTAPLATPAEAAGA